MSKFCANCGAEVSDGYAFCEKCGTPVNDAAPQAAPAGQPVYNQYGPAPQQQAGNGMAVGGFVCSLIGLLLCCGGIVSIVGLILSIIGLNKSKQLNGAGKGLAIAGIILGAIGVLCGVLVGILYGIGAFAEASNTLYY